MEEMQLVENVEGLTDEKKQHPWWATVRSGLKLLYYRKCDSLNE